ncbi:TPA: ATP-binding protein [Klebsiella quasipneumoniae subsp. quasipneumoniae]|nr:ATP-binding protein [Klebsiella quasipneumoniae subsp. quasipneumoniae]
MISGKDIFFSSRHTNSDVTLHVNDITKHSKKYMNKHIYILDIDMYIQTEDMKHQEYIDEDIKSPLKMLFIGGDLTENFLFDLLSKSEISLHEIKVKYKFDYICQISEDGYRFINNKLETGTSLSLLRTIKDFGVNYNIIRNKSFLERYSDKIFPTLLLDNTFSSYAFQNGYKYFNADDGAVYQLQPPTSFIIYDEKKKPYQLKMESLLNINIPIHALIGKNGSGKTYLINKIIKQSISSDIGIRSSGSVFSRMIVLSNTINDKCYRPANITKNKHKLNNYHFVSLTSEKYYNKIFPRGKKLTLFSLLEKIQKRDSHKRGNFEQGYLLDKVTQDVIPEYSFSIKTNLGEHIYNSFSELTGRYGLVNLSSNLELIKDSGIEYALPDEDIQFYKNNEPFTLSSGQLSFLVSMFSLISTIESNSLILIEEPENFLHPSLLTHFINSLTHILRDTNSIAIMATHSALVLREIPRAQITILNRRDNITRYQTPNIETFGADTHQIMIDVFGDLYSNAIFREELSNIAKHKTINELLVQYSDLPSDVLNKIIMEKKSK